MGEPGWRESDEPICIPNQGALDAFAVWADPRGVFALSSISCNPLARIPCGKEGVALQLNDGAGWQTIYEIPPGSTNGSLKLTGFPEGPVVLSGTLAGQFGVSFIEDGTASFQAPLDGIRNGVFVVGAERAYAVDDSRVLEYSSGSWKERAVLPTPGSALWADGDTIVVVGPDQAFYVGSPDANGLRQLPGVPAGDYVSVWGFGPEDLWAGNSAGQLVHYDGADWRVVPTGTRSDANLAVLGLWGRGGTLFFHTAIEFGRVEDGSAEILLAPASDFDPERPRIGVSGIFGLSANEVFIAVGDEEYREFACGEHFLVWFDGSEFHQF